MSAFGDYLLSLHDEETRLVSNYYVCPCSNKTYVDSQAVSAKDMYDPAMQKEFLYAFDENLMTRQ